MLLTSHHLTKSYLETSTEASVLQELDFKLTSGEFVAIMGSSGSGKSTLLHILGGLDRPTSGEVWYDNQPLHQMSEKAQALFRRKSIGFVFQDHHLLPGLTVLENLMLPALLLDSNRSSIRERGRELLKDIGLEGLEDRFPSQISGGERQRVAIARASMNRPHILIVDEPTGNLNGAASRQVLHLLQKFHQRGQTILMVTHDVHTASLASRICFLQGGKIADELLCEDILVGERTATIFHWLSQKDW